MTPTITTSSAPALTFHETSFDLVEHDDGQIWLRLPQIEGALGYSHSGRAVANLYERNAAEFTDRMTAVVKLQTAGGLQDVRIFSLRGAHLLGMFARTERAAEFRRWVLDVLEQQSAPPPVARLAQDTFERVVSERDALRAMLAERVLREEPRLRKVIYYYGIPGLSHKERATLMGWKTTLSWFESLKRLAVLGLVDYQPDPALSARGKVNIAKRQQAFPPKARKEATPPWRARPGNAERAKKMGADRLAGKKGAGHA